MSSTRNPNLSPDEISDMRKHQSLFSLSPLLILAITFFIFGLSVSAAETSNGWIASRDYGKDGNIVTSRYASKGLSQVELVGASLERQIDIPFKVFDFRVTSDNLVRHLYEFAPQDISVNLLRSCNAILGSGFFTGDYGYERAERDDCIIHSAWGYSSLRLNFIIDTFKDGGDDPPVEVISFGLSNGTGSNTVSFLEISRGSLCGEAGDVSMCWHCFTNFEYMAAGEAGDICKKPEGSGSTRHLVTASVMMPWSTFAMHWQEYRDKHAEDPQLAIIFARQSGARWDYRYLSTNLIDSLLHEREAHD